MVKRNKPKTFSKPERIYELKLGGRVLRAGDIIKVARELGEFKITGFETDGQTVHCRGGAPAKGDRGPIRLDRAFFVDRISTRKALAGSERAERWA